MKNIKFITIFEGWWTVRQLEKLKDLIRHQKRWAHQINLARPLRELGIDENDPRRRELIREKIHNIIPLATKAANKIGISTTVLRKEIKVGTFPLEYEDLKYDVFMNYDLLTSKDRPSADHFNLTIDLLNQIIGMYKDATYRKAISMLNPLTLIASILRVPISIIEKMGFDTHGKLAETVLSIILRAIWILFLSVLTVYYSAKSDLIREFIKLITKQ